MPYKGDEDEVHTDTDMSAVKKEVAIRAARRAKNQQKVDNKGKELTDKKAKRRIASSLVKGNKQEEGIHGKNR
jgi:hypothetical protein